MLADEFGQSLPEVAEWIPTGSPALDKAIKQGIPVGRLVEFYGLESCGKSTLLEHVYLGVRRALNGLVVDLDTECTRDRGKLARMGLLPSEFVYRQPDYLEEAFDMIETVLKRLEGAGFPAVLGLDSICVATKAELDGDEAGYAEHARRVASALRKWPRRLWKARASWIVINQLKMSSRGGKPIETTFAGNAVKFHATIRIKLWIKEIIRDENERPIGLRVVAKVVKNKLAPPMREADLPMFFDTGIDAEASVLLTLESQGLLAQNKSWYYLTTKSHKVCFQMQAAQRYAGWKAHLAERPGLLDEAVDLLWNPAAAEIIGATK